MRGGQGPLQGHKPRPSAKLHGCTPPTRREVRSYMTIFQREIVSLSNGKDLEGDKNSG